VQAFANKFLLDDKYIELDVKPVKPPPPPPPAASSAGGAR
jgi:hypothetical protein